MQEQNNDPIGQAILDFAKEGKAEDIIVASDLCDDDIIPTNYLFRTPDEMPLIERAALDLCTGKILDVGAAAGCHAIYLKEQNKEVHAIDTSKRAVEFLNEKGIDARQVNFYDLKDEKYDTILMLMNGIGMAGTLSNVDNFLNHAKSLLTPEGKILIDSTDIMYLYEDEDGSVWVDLNTEYYGNFRYQMKYKNQESEWFDWLYLDAEKFLSAADRCGLDFEVIETEDYSFLVQLTIAQ